ncbi:PREDICTED: uncharacterized protein LOC104704827 [Camelina sativa]|uniref:Uncharacterized protein LOC104704827 n=1 Tax=Camelina sativa TaxID=90675 RepID=A0ABM0T0Y0_CAMSA|nr:PREDICTED: uncharacterized protein LOC104704827 [Camelina sativa]
MAAVPINTPPESSEEEFSNSKVSYSYEDDSMEVEQSDSENTNGATGTNANGNEDEFWVQYPALKEFLPRMARFLGNDNISEYYLLEKAKLLGDDVAKELNDKYEALRIKELEYCSLKLSIVSDVLSLMKP